VAAPPTFGVLMPYAIHRSSPLSDMKFANNTVVACLISTVLSYPSPPLDNADVIVDFQPFVGPPTRDQRLSEGWIDEAAKYFRKFPPLAICYYCILH
jgi:hypothetical protein